MARTASTALAKTLQQRGVVTLHAAAVATEAGAGAAAWQERHRQVFAWPRRPVERGCPLLADDDVTGVRGADLRLTSRSLRS